MNKWLKIALWSLFGIVVITLLVWVRNARDQQLVPKPEVSVVIDGENAFITESELITRLQMKGLLFEGQTWEQLQVDSIERFVFGISQVKLASVYTRVGGSWRIEVELRDPIARIFNKFDESFYLDEEGVVMSTTPSYTSRCLVVTGNIYDKRNCPSVNDIMANDSLKNVHKMDDIFRIANYIKKDELIKTLIGQVHLKKNGDFVLVPLLGEAKIVFGSAHSDKEVAKKFEKLKIFYKEAFPSVGWGEYKEISLKYDDQIIGKKD